MVCPVCDNVLLLNESLELIQTHEKNVFTVRHQHKTRVKCHGVFRVTRLQFDWEDDIEHEAR